MLKGFTIITSLLFICSVFSGCNKNQEIGNIVNSTLVDSIIKGNQNLKFIYDNRDRVIEDRYQIGDTLMERSTYEYTINDSMPFKKNHYVRLNTTPEYVSLLQYNGNKQKIYDSTFGFWGHTIARISYYNGNMVAIKQNYFDHFRFDTLYLNSSGNTDSIRSYNMYTTTPDVSVYSNTIKFSQPFFAYSNVFRSLNIAACNFYELQSYNFGNFYIRKFFTLDYFNPNYFGTIACTSTFPNSTATGTYTAPYYLAQNQLQFNTNNLPTSGILNGLYYNPTPSYNEVANYRIVYQ